MGGFGTWKGAAQPTQGREGLLFRVSAAVGGSI